MRMEMLPPTLSLKNRNRMLREKQIRSGIKLFLSKRRRKLKDPLTLLILTRRLKKKRSKWS
jgi:hypothetical protein